MTVWIPENKVFTGEEFVTFGGEGNPCAYRNMEAPPGTCRECGTKDAFVVSECVLSTRSVVWDWCGEERADDMTGDLEGDLVCTCLGCGAVESGSAPFDLIRQEA